MKIFEIARFNNLIKNINENISLSDLRKKLIKNEVSISDEEKSWYEDDTNKKSLLDIINTIVGPEANKSINNKLKSFDTEKYFKKGVIKPQSLKNVLSLKLLLASHEDSKDKLENQYEKISLNDDIDIYAIYTPKANIILSHKILKSNQIPTWCIASPTSATKYWEHYNLWNAKFPSVFIIVKKGITVIKSKDGGGNYIKDEKSNEIKTEEVTNLKYEIMCEPDDYNPIYDFLRGYSTFEDIVTECRDALQHEKDYEESSLFEYMNITKDDIENTMKRLLNSKKSAEFTIKYGKDNLIKIKHNTNSEDDEIRLNALMRASQMGLLSEVSSAINNSEEADFFISYLVKIDNLCESDLKNMLFTISKDVIRKCLDSLIKNKKCTEYSLKLSEKYGLNEYFNPIFNSLEESSFNWHLLDYIIKTGHDECIKSILDVLIKKEDGHRDYLALLIKKPKYFDYYLEQLLKKNEANNDLLLLVVNKSSDENIQKLLKKMMEKEEAISSYTLHILLQKNKAKFAKNVLEYLDAVEGIYHTDLDCLIKYENDELINFALKSMFKNSTIDDYTFLHLIKNGYVNYADKVFDYLLKNKTNFTSNVFFLSDLTELENLSYFEKLFEKFIESNPNSIDKSFVERYIYKGNSELNEIIMNILIKHQWKLKDLLDICLDWKSLSVYTVDVLKMMKEKELIDENVINHLKSNHKEDLLNKI